MGSIVMGGPPKPKTVVVPRQKYPEACVWQPTSNLLVLFKFFVGYSFLVSRPTYIKHDARVSTQSRSDVAAPRRPGAPLSSRLAGQRQILGDSHNARRYKPL